MEDEVGLSLCVQRQKGCVGASSRRQSLVLRDVNISRTPEALRTPPGALEQRLAGMQAMEVRGDRPGTVCPSTPDLPGETYAMSYFVPPRPNPNSEDL